MKREQSTGFDSGDEGFENEEVRRGGLVLRPGPSYRIRSLYDLCGAALQIEVDGADQVLDSPWSADPRSVSQVLPELQERLTTQTRDTIAGRININLAPREVLLGIPGMTPDLAGAIVAAQRGIGGDPLAERDQRQRSTAWLLYEGLADMPRVRSLAPYITLRGDVYRVEVIGHFDQGGPLTRLQAVIDASRRRARILQFRDIAPPPAGVGSKLLPPSRPYPVRPPLQFSAASARGDDRAPMTIDRRKNIWERNFAC